MAFLFSAAWCLCAISCAAANVYFGHPLLAAFAGAVAGANGYSAVRSLRSRPSLPPPPINVVNGLVLPMPDDPRWTDECGGLRCGPVHVFDAGRYSVNGKWCRVKVDGDPCFSDAWGRYADAVIAAHDRRIECETRARQARALDEFMNT